MEVLKTAVFLQQKNHSRNKEVRINENPNNIEVYIYLFAGTGTRYLSTVAGEYFGFASQKTLLPLLKWYAIVATNLTHQTKSLCLLGKTLPVGLLILLTYYENYLKQHHHYSIYAHMTLTLETQTLLFMLLNSFDLNLQHMIGQSLTTITLCVDSHIIQSFQTNQAIESINQIDLKHIYNHFPSFLCLNYTTWNNILLSLITQINWT